MTRRALPATGAVALLSIWIALVGNLALWRRLISLGVLAGPSGWLLAFAMFAIIGALVSGLLSLVTWPGVFKPAAIGLLLVVAFAGHFMLSYGVVMDPGMLTNAMQTDAHELQGLLNWRLGVAVIAVAALPGAILLRQPISFQPVRRQLARNALLLVSALVLTVAMAVASFQSLAALMRNHKDVRYLINPLASLYSLGRVAAKPWQRADGKLIAVGTDAHVSELAATGQRPTLLLLVLGETARSDHLGINGYDRDTMPTLARSDVVSFRNAWACGTSTAASVPCMFSHLPREQFEARKNQYEGLLDVLQHAGLAVLWLDNQSGCKGVCDRVPHLDTTASNDSSHCAGGDCLDGVMLEGLDARIGALDPTRVRRGLVIVMHQMGSHGPAYHRRSPASVKRFVPECTTSALADCSRESVVNAYDNSILYTDKFLGEAIAWLKDRASVADTAMVYVSDHGESLGENNIYLHGLPYVIAPDAQKHVPWITWASEAYQRNKRLSMSCLRGVADTRLSHDNYFHSVLGLMKVKSSYYDPAMDFYAKCRLGSEDSFAMGGAIAPLVGRGM